MDAAPYLHVADETASRADRRVRDDVRGDCVALIYELARDFSCREVFEDVARMKCRRVLLRHHRELFRPKARRLPDAEVSASPLPDPVEPPFRSAAKRRQTERDLVIAAALAHGVPQALIARVVGVAQSKVSKIAQEFAPTPVG